MPLESPKFRNACENCHKKKIRCRLSLHQAACESCAATGTACLFAPRVKTGRPRLVKTPSLPPAQTPQATEEKDTPSDSQSEPRTDAAASTPADETPNPSQSQAVFKQSSSQTWMLDEPSEFGEVHDMDELNQHTFQSVQSLDRRQRTTSNDSQSISSGSSQSLIEGRFPPSIGLLTPSLASTPGELDTGDPSDLGFDFGAAPGSANTGLDFNAALRICAKLEQHSKLLQEVPYEPMNTEAILGDIDLACRTVMQPLSDLSVTNDASSALVVAAVYKVFEICEAFVRLGFMGTPNQDLETDEHLLLLKRLDLVLLRAKIYLTRMGQHAAATKASSISSWIESLVKQQYQHWMW